MDLVVGSLLAVSTIAVIAIAVANQLYVQASKMRDVVASAYQLAGHILLNDDLEERELNVGETLLLDVLADPEGVAAKELEAAPAGVAYSAIAAKIALKRVQTHGDEYVA